MKTLNKFLEQAEPVQQSQKEDPKVKQAEKKESMLKRRVLMAKMRAVRQGATGIMASYEPNIEGIVEYFYEEGINEEGFDQLIEEIGLEEFVNFVDESSLALNEERAARRATVRAKKYDVVKKEVDKADAARKKAKKGEYAPSYAKKETDVTVYDDKPAAKKKAPKKPVAPKKPIAPKKPVRTKKPVTKKVVKAVAKVKKTQPAKKPSKQGLGDRISAAYKAGVKRHRKATQGARVFGKGFAAGAKKAVKFAKDVKKVVSEEEMNEGIMQMMKRVKKKPEKKAEKAMDAGARAKRKLARKVHAKYVSGSEDNVPDDIREGDVHSGQGEKIQKRTKAWMDKKGMKGAPGLDAMKARTAEHKAKRGVKEEVVDEGKKKGLWDNIHAKRKRGEKPAKPGDKDYPKTLNVEGIKQARKNVGADKCWDGYKAKGTKKKGGKEVPNCVKEGAAWTKKAGKNPEGGLNEKGRKSYERENPGSDLKAPQPEGGSRKKSFCARMGGMKKKLTSKKTANDPDSRINKSLRKWKCNEEDKAYQYVVSKLKKKYGDGVLTKGDKIKPKTAAQKKAAAAHQAKVDRENAAERAKDPSQGRYPPGYSNRGSD